MEVNIPTEDENIHLLYQVRKKKRWTKKILILGIVALLILLSAFYFGVRNIY